MAKQQQAVERVVCPLFAEVQPPVYADEVGEIRVHKMAPGSREGRGTIVNFSKERYIQANDGEEFIIDPGSTKEQELAKVLEADPPGTRYTLTAYDSKTGAHIPRAMRFLRTDADEEDEEEEEMMPPMPPPSGGGSDRVFDLLSTLLRDKEKNADRPVELAVQMANAMTQKEAPSVLVEELRAEIRTMRTKTEDEILRIRREAAKEVDDVRDQLRTERAAAQRREDEARAELRTLREKTDRELSEARMQAQSQIYQLQQTNLNLQQQLQGEVLSAQRNLLQVDVARQMAERDAKDAQSAIDAMNERSEEEMKSAAGAAAAEGIPGWLKPFTPFFPLVVQWAKSQGMAIPKELLSPGEQPPQQPLPQQPPQPVQRPAPPPMQAQPRPAPAPFAPPQALPQQQPAPTPMPRVPTMPVPISQEESEEEPEESDGEVSEDEAS